MEIEKSNGKIDWTSRVNLKRQDADAINPGPMIYPGGYYRVNSIEGIVEVCMGETLHLTPGKSANRCHSCFSKCNE
ncbi:hypothetical protein M0804_007053 [Polistes exclamans]|nr:hypothetical protein M0804_007053 [Polistes exclamans]